jgi:hypothetical protein
MHDYMIDMALIENDYKKITHVLKMVKKKEERNEKYNVKIRNLEEQIQNENDIEVKE